MVRRCMYIHTSQPGQQSTSFVFSAVSLLDEKKEEGVPHFHFTKGGADDIRVMNRVYMKRIVASSITPPQVVCMYYGFIMVGTVARCTHEEEDVISFSCSCLLHPHLTPIPLVNALLLGDPS